MQPSAEVTQVTDRPLGLLDRVRDRAARLRADLPAGRALKGEDHVDQPLLGPVVQIASEPAPLLERGLDDARARSMNRFGPPPVRLGAPLLGNVAKHDHRPPLTGHADRRRRVRDRDERSVAPNEPVLVDPHRLAGGSRPQERALGFRKR